MVQARARTRQVASEGASLVGRRAECKPFRSGSHHPIVRKITVSPRSRQSCASGRDEPPIVASAAGPVVFRKSQPPSPPVVGWTRSAEVTFKVQPQRLI